jgi:hypothetical protein
MSLNGQPKKRGRPHRITDKQRVWINEYLIDMNGTRAARVAGFKHPDVAAAKLLNPDKYPLVAAEVRKALAEKQLSSLMTAEEVRRYIHTTLKFCPGDYFLPGHKGNQRGWLIEEEDYRRLPQEIRQLVEEMETRTQVVETPDGTRVTKNYLWVKFVSKTVALGLAAKYSQTEKHSVGVGVTQVPWDELFRSVPKEVPDLIEAEIERARQVIEPLPAPDLGMNGYLVNGANGKGTNQGPGDGRRGDAP